MLLADGFGVPKVLAVAAAAVAAVPAVQLDWDTALQLLQLPRSCALQPDFKAAHQLALCRMIQQLGDLEKVWSSDALQQQLLALPFGALLQLLQHEDTRVATENTVVFTIERWQRAQGAGQGRREQVQQLVQLVRMRHCTPDYAGTIMPHSRVVRHSIERSAVPLMRECCMPGGYDKLDAGEHLSKRTEAVMSADLDDWGFTNLVCLGTERSWQAVKAELYSQELVHGGGYAGAALQGCHLHSVVKELD
jgi:hypothetical protein